MDLASQINQLPEAPAAPLAEEWRLSKAVPKPAARAAEGLSAFWVLHTPSGYELWIVLARDGWRLNHLSHKHLRGSTDWIARRELTRVLNDWARAQGMFGIRAQTRRELIPILAEIYTRNSSTLPVIERRG